MLPSAGSGRSPVLSPTLRKSINDKAVTGSAVGRYDAIAKTVQQALDNTPNSVIKTPHRTPRTPRTPRDANFPKEYDGLLLLFRREQALRKQAEELVEARAEGGTVPPIVSYLLVYALVHELWHTEDVVHTRHVHRHHLIEGCKRP